MNNFYGNRCGCPPFIPPCPPPRPLCSATVTVGSTITLEAGQPAYVTNTGTLQNAILNFGIPTGATGATGPQGEAGTAATVTVGTTTTLPAGSTATVTNSGTSNAAILNFGIPTGATGATGPQGEAGIAATVTVGTTTTLPAGSTATVTNSGTSNAAILNFGIPTGATGATGPQGEAGTAATITVGTVTALDVGETPTVTNSGTTSAAILDFGIPTITQGAAVADLAEDATLETVITTINALLASLRTAGVIATAV